MYTLQARASLTEGPGVFQYMYVRTSFYMSGIQHWRSWNYQRLSSADAWRRPHSLFPAGWAGSPPKMATEEQMEITSTDGTLVD